MTAPTPNAALAYAVLDHIDAHPERHDQEVWIYQGEDCNTVACLAGWACLLGGDRPDFDPEEPEACKVFTDQGLLPVKERAAQLLGIPYDPDALFGHALFSQHNTREDLGRLVAEIFGPRPQSCGYPLEHPAHDWTLLANSERPHDQDAHCDGLAEDLPNAGSAS